MTEYDPAVLAAKVARALDLAEVEALIAEIKELEDRLAPLYVRRREVFLELDKTMSQREVGAFFGVSGTAVNHVINRNKYKLPKENV